ncbi:DUF4265 domain-containing protein [Luteipulveratus sp. YIM 133132]|uniref:DUF4265 domain-containing protein n=1 Tax=Luteipulveratus flavus TaxID=3031728 RepID=UPI0023AF35A7|nr:DUF4265 domain-containing protein [Luteipulveratus sp. YIM 133132]MDE9364149.1 DUF4265 domain-containing protein [Luteipulveratus sp. YIM 133132]
MEPTTAADGAAEPDARVVFELKVEDGWPPVSSERLWASSTGPDRYVIANVPWFVPDLAVGDVILARPPAPDQHPVFREVLERSDHVTIRLIRFRDGPLRGDLARAMEPFTRLGVHAEGADQFGMLALDIAADDPMDELVATLRSGQDAGWWEFEEGRITPAWIEATGP